MIQPALLALVHADDTGMQLLYFWAAVLLALTPILIFGTIGVWVARMIWKERKATRNAEVGTRN
jgi:lauroyl/myristoyl acyltransferase